MKIVIAVHHFPPRFSAGAELYSFRLAGWLIEQGHAVEVVCVEQTDRGAAGEVIDEFDTYHGVPVHRLSLNLSLASDPFRWSYANPLIERWFGAYLGRQRPDLVHLQSGYLISASVLAAARKQAVPTLLTLHDFWFLCPRTILLRGNGNVCTDIPADPAACAWCALLDSRRYRLPDQLTGGLVGKAFQELSMEQQRRAGAARRAYLAQALQWPALVIAPSHFLATKFQHLVGPERLRVVRLGIDTARLATTPLAENGVLRLGYIGQIASHKGVHLLVRAMRLLPKHGTPVELVIYGDLKANPAYVRQIQQLIGDDQRIRLAGRFDNNRISEIMRELHTTVVPSLWYENSPLAILEAQAARRPVIVAAHGGMAELVRDEVDGLYIRPGDVHDLARQITRLREQPALLAQLRQGIKPPPSVADEMQTLFGIYEQMLRRDRSLQG